MLSEFNEWCKSEGLHFKNQSQKRGGLKVFNILYPQKNKKISDAKVKVASVLNELEEVRNALHGDK